MARYKARRAAKQAERDADQRRFMDKGRAAMRTWYEREGERERGGGEVRW